MLDLFRDSSFVERLATAVATQTLDPTQYNIAHYDLVQVLQTTWNPALFQIHKVKSHCPLSQATDVNHLYRVLGNTVADETATLVNKQDIPVMQNACHSIQCHSRVQTQTLSKIYAYLCDLNSLHMTRRIEKEKSQAEESDLNNSDAIAHIQQVLCDWVPDGPYWYFDESLHPVIARACPAGGQIARCVWLFFQQLEWRHPDLALQKSDFGVTWYELTIHFSLYAGRCLPIWIKHKGQDHAWPYAFDSPEVAILKSTLRTPQANTCTPGTRKLVHRP